MVIVSFIQCGAVLNLKSYFINGNCNTEKKGGKAYKLASPHFQEIPAYKMVPLGTSPTR